jgi:hypothetical protein
MALHPRSASYAHNRRLTLPSCSFHELEADVPQLTNNKKATEHSHLGAMRIGSGTISAMSVAPLRVWIELVSFYACIGLHGMCLLMFNGLAGVGLLSTSYCVCRFMQKYVGRRRALDTLDVFLSVPKCMHFMLGVCYDQFYPVGVLLLSSATVSVVEGGPSSSPAPSTWQASLVGLSH